VVSSFYLSISAISDWMSAILPLSLSANLRCRSETCCTRLAENTRHQKSPSGHHRTTSTGYISTTKARIIYWKKNLFVKLQYLPHMSAQYGELRPTSGWDRFVSLGHPS